MKVQHEAYDMSRAELIGLAKQFVADWVRENPEGWAETFFPKQPPGTDPPIVGADAPGDDYVGLACEYPKTMKQWLYTSEGRFPLHPMEVHGDDTWTASAASALFMGGKISLQAAASAANRDAGFFLMFACADANVTTAIAEACSREGGKT